MRRLWGGTGRSWQVWEGWRVWKLVPPGWVGRNHRDPGRDTEPRSVVGQHQCDIADQRTILVLALYIPIHYISTSRVSLVNYRIRSAFSIPQMFYHKARSSIIRLSLRLTLQVFVHFPGTVDSVFSRGEHHWVSCQDNINKTCIKLAESLSYQARHFF